MDLLSKTSGIDQTIVGRLDRKLGLAVARERIAYLFSDEFKGSSADADDQILESVKDFNLGPFDVPIG